MGVGRSGATSGGRDNLGLVGESPSVEQVRRTIRAVARRRCPVLVRGESGTGKELIARALHHASGRPGELITVDCTTLRDTLMESQLFGHVRGAFTGADRETTGFIRAAHAGTLFLDEVGELPLPLQAKLLRFLQEGSITPLGSVRPVQVDARVICATHRDLKQLVADGTFRLDLYYRLNIVQVHSPALRDRRDDIPTLARHLLHRIATNYAEPAKVLTPAAEAALTHHDWPGNIRELANALEHAVILGESSAIDASDLPACVAASRTRAPIEPSVDAVTPALPLIPLDDAQRQLVRAALEATAGHRGRAATLLGVERRRLYRLVDRYGLRSLAR